MCLFFYQTTVSSGCIVLDSLQNMWHYSSQSLKLKVWTIILYVECFSNNKNGQMLSISRFFIFELVPNTSLDGLFSKCINVILRFEHSELCLIIIQLKHILWSIRTLISDTHCSISDNLLAKQSCFLIVTLSCVSSAYEWYNSLKRWTMSDTGLVYICTKSVREQNPVEHQNFAPAYPIEYPCLLVVIY